MTLTLTVYRATPSLNEFANIRRSNAWKYRSLRSAWHYDIGQALLEARSQVRRPLAWPRPPQERVLVCVTRYAPAHHWLDPDNLTGGLKPVLDALKAHELIANDRSSDIDLVVNQAISESNMARWTAIRLSLDPPVVREIHA
jgi:hypothetical protein